jgi:preprotein translocase subunit SecG
MATFVATVFVIICILLIVVVLLQKGRGVGLGGAFGGVGSSAFGTRTGDVFTWVTIVLTGVFLLLAVGTALYFRPSAEKVKTCGFIPDGKPIAKAINVTIQCGISKAEVFFTVDGSEPTRASLRYDTPVRVEPGTTLKARAFLRGWKDSDVATALYPPLAASAPAGTVRPPATASASAPTRPGGAAR